MPVVVMEPVGERGGALTRGRVRLGVGPLPEAGLDEALGLAVGPGRVRLSAQMTDLELCAGVSEGMRDVRRPIVGHDALDAYAAALEVGDGRFEEGGRGITAFIGSDAGERQAGVVVDGDVDVLPAGLAKGTAVIARDAMPYARDSAEFFRIKMQQLTGTLTLIATNRWAGLELAPTRQMGPTQDARDACSRDTQT